MDEQCASKVDAHTIDGCVCALNGVKTSATLKEQTEKAILGEVSVSCKGSLKGSCALSPRILRCKLYFARNWRRNAPKTNFEVVIQLEPPNLLSVLKAQTL